MHIKHKTKIQVTHEYSVECIINYVFFFSLCLVIYDYQQGPLYLEWDKYYFFSNVTTAFLVE